MHRAVRVLLFKPPIRSSMVEVGRHMPIGLAYVAAALRAEGIDVEIFDALAETEGNHVVDPADYTAADRAKVAAHPRWSQLVHWGADWERIDRELAERDYDILGLSCMFTPYYEPAFEVARRAKRLRPDLKVLLGGQHGTVATAHALSEPAIDAVVLGEAEQRIGQIVGALAEGRPLTGIAGVGFRCGEGLCRCAIPLDRVHIQENAGFAEDLDAFPRPAVDLLDMTSYDNTATLITSRGCPFSCSFCTVHATVGKKFRYRAPEAVVAEIADYVHNHDIRRFFIEDDNFTFDVARVHEICAAIADSGLDVELHLPNGMTVVKLSDDMVAAMASAGFKSLFLGLESTDTVRLRKIRKGFTSLEKVEAGAALFRENSVDVGASLIVGLLGQDLVEIARDSINLMVAGVRFWTNPFYPIPGSPDYERCRADGLISHDTEPALFDQFNFAVGSDVLSPAELYWAWIATQAMAQWPHYVLEGVAARRSSGDAVSFEHAAAELLRHSEQVMRVDGTLEVPAVPVDFTGPVVTVDAEGCFHAVQGLADRSRPPDFCMLTGDVIAAALALYCGRAFHAVPRHASGDPQCRFELVEGADDRAYETVQRTFVDELDSLDDPVLPAAAGSRRAALATMTPSSSS
jgi:radical SAM superfamily enzyme YgiQ (UPF0313 family)